MLKVSVFTTCYKCLTASMLPHLSEIVWMYIITHNHASKTIFKNRKICKICTANICPHYM
jgi:hypothetical protein